MEIPGTPHPPAAALALIADPTRARMLSLIAHDERGEATVTRLAETLGLRQPTVSHHAKALYDGGVLRRRPQGRQVWYSIAPQFADRITDLLGEPPSRTDESVLERVGHDLAERFTGVFSRETVEQYVRESHTLLAEKAGIDRHLPSLTAQFAGDRLAALATARHESGGSTEVLFVCVQNAGRSQLAAAILRHLAGDRVRVRTAGSAPASAVRSNIVTALDEIGVPLGGEFPKPLTDEVVRAADVVITMGCGDACPVYPGRRYLDWNLPDPLDLPLPEVRAIRDEIESRVRALLPELVETVPVTSHVTR